MATSGASQPFVASSTPASSTLPPSDPSSDDPETIAIAIAASVALLAIIGVIIFVMVLLKKKRARRSKRTIQSDAEKAKQKQDRKLQRRKEVTIRSDGKPTIRELIKRTKPIMLDVLWEIDETSCQDDFMYASSGGECSDTDKMPSPTTDSPTTDSPMWTAYHSQPPDLISSHMCRSNVGN